MTVLNATNSTIADYFYLAIQTQYIAIATHEAEAIDSFAPEAIHQMRVNLRKMRSTIAAGDYLLKLPESCQDRPIGKIARTLGKLRDKDVLIASCSRYRSDLPDKECNALDRAMEIISIDRQQSIAKVREIFTQKKYRRFKLSINNWLNEPEYTVTQTIPLTEILPDLILARIGRLFIHPAWYIIPESIDLESLADLMDTHHDLRKQIKATRYLLEIFSDINPPIYHQFILDLKQAQKYLGRIQDCLALDRYLADNLGKKAYLKLTTLKQQLTAESSEYWQRWHQIQQHYRDAGIKHDLRSGRS
jgi:CHAD domain-containing protein